MTAKERYSNRIVSMDLGSPRLTSVLKIAKRYAPRKVIMDVGCSDGSFALQLGNVVEAKEIHGIDISKPAIEDAMQKGILARLSDLDEDLPWDRDSFDLVFCGNVIEVIGNPDHLFLELRRVLKPTGVLILTHPALSSWMNRIAVGLGYQPYYDRVSTRYSFGKLLEETREIDVGGTYRLYSFRGFREFARLYRYRTMEVVGVQTHNAPRVVRGLDSAFSRLPQFASELIWVLSKD